MVHYWCEGKKGEDEINHIIAQKNTLQCKACTLKAENSLGSHSRENVTLSLPPVPPKTTINMSDGTLHTSLTTADYPKVDGVHDEFDTSSLTAVHQCPTCLNDVDLDGVLCETCEDWYHYHCEKLSASEIKYNETEDEPLEVLADAACSSLEILAGAAGPNPTRPVDHNVSSLIIDRPADSVTFTTDMSQSAPPTHPHTSGTLVVYNSRTESDQKTISTQSDKTALITIPKTVYEVTDGILSHETTPKTLHGTACDILPMSPIIVPVTLHNAELTHIHPLPSPCRQHQTGTIPGVTTPSLPIPVRGMEEILRWNSITH
jgi:hypothetical protein